MLEVVLCIVGWLAASLDSTHYVPAASSPQFWQLKLSPDITKYLRGRVAKCPRFRVSTLFGQGWEQQPPAAPTSLSSAECQVSGGSGLQALCLEAPASPGWPAVASSAWGVGRGGHCTASATVPLLCSSLPLRCAASCLSTFSSPLPMLPQVSRKGSKDRPLLVLL